MIKRNLLLASAMFCSVAAFADTNISVYQGDDVSVRVVSPNTKMKFAAGKVTLGDVSFETSKVDSFVLKHFVSVSFDGDNVTVSNPFDSVDVKVEKTSVLINSNYKEREIKYKFSGKSTNGNVVFSSLYKSKFEFDNLALVSDAVNPPIYVQTKKKTEIHLTGTNSLKNSANDTVGATIRGRGQFEFKGDGTLDITSVVGHGIQSSDYVEVKHGTLNIDAASDGIHVNDYYLQSGGNVSIKMQGDGVDVGEGYAEINGGEFVVKSDADDARGIRCSYEPAKNNSAKIDIDGGKVDIQLSGKGARGLKSDGSITVDGGDLLVVMSGATKVVNEEPAVTCGIKSDSIFTVESGNVVVICQSTALGSRCVQADTSIIINGGLTTLYQNCNNTVEGAKPSYVVKSDGNLKAARAGLIYVAYDTDLLAKPYKLKKVYVGSHKCEDDPDEDDYDVEDYIFPIPTDPDGYWDAYEKYVK